MAKEDKDKIEVEVTGDALENENKKVEGDKNNNDGDDEKKGFFATVWNAFNSLAETTSKKLDEVYSDDSKRRNFLSGLETIIEAGSYQPITQAKSPLAKFAVGQKKGMLASKALELQEMKALTDRIKALNTGKEKRYRPVEEEFILKEYSKYQEDYNKSKAGYNATSQAFDTLAKSKNYDITGIMEDFFLPLEKIADSLGYSDVITRYRQSKAENKEYVPDQKEILKLKEIFDATSKTRILSKVKDLYPVSNADIEILLKGQGSLSTNSGALKVLISSEKALADIETLAYDKAQSLAFPGGDLKGDVNFKKNAADAAAKELAAQYNDKVSDELLKELYGNTDRTDFRVIQAFNFKNLKADKAYEGSSFEKFLEGKADTLQETNSIISKYQEKKKEN